MQMASSHKQILLIKLQGGHQANRSKIDTHLSSQQSNNKRGIMVEQTRFSWASKCLFHLWAGKKTKQNQTK
jgi:hypothetical protein